MSQVNLNKTVFPLWINFNSKSTNQIGWKNTRDWLKFKMPKQEEK